MQQDRGGDSSDIARCPLTGDASDLLVAIQNRHARSARTASEPHRFSPSGVGRFHALGSVRARGVAALAGITLPGGAQRSRHLRRYAHARAPLSQRSIVPAELSILHM